MEKTICPKCKYSWFPRIEKPKACPMCKCYLNRDDLKKLRYYNSGILRKKRILVIKRANGLCEKCGKKGKGVRVHHKDGKKKDHSLKNLILLCTSCHGKAHWILNKKRKTKSLSEM